MNFHPFNDEGVRQRSEAISKLASELYAKHAAKVEALTREQLATVIEQAILCGDFRRLVRVDNQAQSVIYIPYEREQELESEIKSLKAEINDLKCEMSNLGGPAYPSSNREEGVNHR